MLLSSEAKGILKSIPQNSCSFLLLIFPLVYTTFFNLFFETSKILYVVNLKLILGFAVFCFDLKQQTSSFFLPHHCTFQYSLFYMIAHLRPLIATAHFMSWESLFPLGKHIRFCLLFLGISVQRRHLYFFNLLSYL